MLKFAVIAFYIMFHSIYAKALISISGTKSFIYMDTNHQSHEINFSEELDSSIKYIAVIRHESATCAQCIVYLVETDSGNYFLRYEERALGYFVPVVSGAASVSSMLPLVTHVQGENSLLQLKTTILGVEIPKIEASSKTGRIITTPVSVNKQSGSSNFIELRKKDSSERIEGKMQIIEELRVNVYD